MKIAVIFSGLLRGDYEKNIRDHREAFPDADFYFTTWKYTSESDRKKWSKNGKFTLEHPLIQKYFIPPKIHYDPSLEWVKPYIRLLRKMKETNWDMNYIPPDLRWMGKEKLEKQAHLVITNSRNIIRHQNKQHVIYALTVKELVDQSKYDILVRTRYDTVLDPDFVNHVDYLTNIANETGYPIGFHHFNNDGLEGILDPAKFLRIRKAHDIYDFMIMHKSSKYDPDYVLNLFKNKDLKISECGWWQSILGNDTENDFAIEAKGYVRLQSQLFNEKKTLAEFKKIKPDDHKQIHKKFKEDVEKMGFMRGNIADVIDGKMEYGVQCEREYKPGTELGVNNVIYS